MRVYYLSDYYNWLALDCWLRKIFDVSSFNLVSCYTEADLVVAPGVCNSRQIFIDDLKAACSNDSKKVLCICGGFQALFGSNDESGITGANIFAGKVVKLKNVDGVGFAQTGFLRCADDNEYFFNNCYGVKTKQLKNEAFELFHDNFLIMKQSHNILGYQFHPELSGGAQAALKAQTRSWFYGN